MRLRPLLPLLLVVRPVPSEVEVALQSRLRLPAQHSRRTVSHPADGQRLRRPRIDLAAVGVPEQQSQPLEIHGSVPPVPMMSLGGL